MGGLPSFVSIVRGQWPAPVSPFSAKCRALGFDADGVDCSSLGDDAWWWLVRSPYR